MSTQLTAQPSPAPTDRQLLTGLRKALEQSYTRILHSARYEWERQCAAKDPSDACVSVRIAPRVRLGRTRVWLPGS
jgi:hypothetical protein